MKKKDEAKKQSGTDIIGLKAAVLEQEIDKTLEKNYMPYAMSVIVSRAIPEIDGFKPSHRKLLFTMYKMGLLTGARTKSANIVGQTMRLNPHGDAAIYETMVRLSRGYEALLHPFIDSKGNFGKVYSRDMAYAASRYTEAKLDSICSEIFSGIDQDTVDFIPNYDNKTKEPVLLPTAFPNVLVSANQGIAVGMASMICGFNLKEVCETAAEYIKNPGCDIMATLKAPDFPTGGEIIFDYAAMRSIYETGRGTFKLRSRWRFVKDQNLVEIYEIPYTTTTEAVIDKVAELVKSGKLKEISDMRDETGLSGLKLAIDLKRGTDPEKLMQKLFKQTTLMDSFSCNFNILIAGMPRVMGIPKILEEWTAWRVDCVRRGLYFEMDAKKKKLHLLNGLKKILLDIDRAIEIIKETEEEAEVVPNLMIGFGIDNIQAEYIAEIKLRNINKEFILKRVEETKRLKNEIDELSDTINDTNKLNKIIIKELSEIAKKYGTERSTGIVYEHEVERYKEEEHIEDYPVTLFLSKEGYFKKITPLSLRMSGEHKYKENDGPFLSFEASNKSELLIFTDKKQVYKAHVHEFEDTKASVLGDYLPTRMDMDDGESVIFMCDPGDYTGNLLIFFENGKAARITMGSFDTKSNRRRLTGAYSDKSPAVCILQITDDTEIAVFSSDGRVLVLNTAALAPKTTRSTQGVNVMSLKARAVISSVMPLSESIIVNPARYRVRSLPSAGAFLKTEDTEEIQLVLE